uniref:Acid sphingomyelinase-like phosphodiesterase 3a-like n=1 Tax=Saccoglossus kowalevskii TaxID=10224 RepID=A0ABM0M694_SACKO|nr:PREDICTED: acid sphingomyelinase-like phosphodiesterase 3a-like [Saccoglossus kowalevskii]
MNLTDANLTGNTTWFKEYSAKSAFNMTSLLPADWQKVVDTFKKNDTLFQEFYRYYNKLHVTSSCDDACKKSMICDLQTARSSDPSLCKDDFFGDVTKLRKQQALC